MTALQLNRVLDLLERWVVLQEQRLKLEFPLPGEPVEAQFIQVGQSNTNQPETPQEYADFPEDEERSFERIIADLQSAKAH